jgi:hypothetical protein
MGQAQGLNCFLAVNKAESNSFRNKAMSEFKLVTQLKPGQWLLYIDLSDLHSKSVAEAIALLQEMGYDPQLRYLETGEAVKLCALLREEQHNPTQSIPDEYRFDELMALYEAFQPEDMAIQVLQGTPAISLY